MASGTSFLIRAGWEPVRSLGFASIGVSYTAVGTPLTHPIRTVFIQNLTNAVLMFSFNGVDDNFPLPAFGYFVWDVTANKTREEGFFLGEGDVLFVKEIGTPTSGSVYFSVVYGEQ